MLPPCLRIHTFKRGQAAKTGFPNSATKRVSECAAPISFQVRILGHAGDSTSTSSALYGPQEGSMGFTDVESVRDYSFAACDFAFSIRGQLNFKCVTLRRTF